jgi:hypothetical protein
MRSIDIEAASEESKRHEGKPKWLIQVAKGRADAPIDTLFVTRLVQVSDGLEPPLVTLFNWHTKKKIVRMNDLSVQQV